MPPTTENRDMDTQTIVSELRAKAQLFTDAANAIEAIGRAPKNRGGRPKGYKMSAATRAKLRAAWKRRKAATN